jgi:redox-sensing transcriptional repressor
MPKKSPRPGTARRHEASARPGGGRTARPEPSRRTLGRVSESIIKRLSLYYRTLSALSHAGARTVSSRELARRERLTPAQVRKDLSLFGNFGTRGLGYPVDALKSSIARILGIDRTWNVAVVGAGHIGTALISYREFGRQGFLIRAIFDNDPAKIGTLDRGLLVTDVDRLEAELVAQKIEIVVLAVPAEAAQSVALRCVRAGVKALLNFAPIQLALPGDVCLRTENMSMELEYLSYSLVNGPRARGAASGDDLP